MLPGETKNLMHPFPADAIPCRDTRDTLPTVIRRDDGSGIFSRQLLHTPGLIGCQVIMRPYIPEIFSGTVEVDEPYVGG
jgi:hypothetical protein